MIKGDVSSKYMYHPGGHQVRQDNGPYQKFASLVVTCEDAKVCMYRFIAKPRIHKWTDVWVKSLI